MDATRGRERKQIKKCHQAPLSLSQGLQLGSPATKKNKKREEKTLLLRLLVLTYTLGLIQVGPPDSSQSPEEANEPNPLSSNEEG